MSCDKNAVSNSHNPVVNQPYFACMLQYLTTWQIISKIAPLSKWHYDYLKSPAMQKVIINLVKREFGIAIFQQTRKDATDLYLQCLGSTLEPSDEPKIWLPSEDCKQYILGQLSSSHAKYNEYRNPYTLIGCLYKPMLCFHREGNFLRKCDREGLQRQIPSWIATENIPDADSFNPYSLWDHPHLRTMFLNRSFGALKSVLFKIISNNDKLPVFRQRSFTMTRRWNHFVGIHANLSSLLSNMFEHLSGYVMNKSTLPYENILLQQILLTDSGSNKDIIYQKWPENVLRNFKIAYYGAVNVTIKDKNGKSKVWDGVEWNKNSPFVDNNVYDLDWFGQTSILSPAIILALRSNNDIRFLSDLFVSCMQYGTLLMTTCTSPKLYLQNDRFYFNFDYWQWILKILKWYHTKECAVQDFGIEIDRARFATFDYFIQCSESFIKEFYLAYFEQAFKSTIAIVKTRMASVDEDSVVILDMVEKMFLHKIILVAFALGDLRWQQNENIEQFTKLRGQIEAELVSGAHDETEKEYQFISQIEKKMKNEFTAGFTALQQVWRDNLIAMGKVVSERIGGNFDFGSFFMAAVDKTKKLGKTWPWGNDFLAESKLDLNMHIHEFFPPHYVDQAKQ